MTDRPYKDLSDFELYKLYKLTIKRDNLEDPSKSFLMMSEIIERVSPLDDILLYDLFVLKLQERLLFNLYRFLKDNMSIIDFTLYESFYDKYYENYLRLFIDIIKFFEDDYE